MARVHDRVLAAARKAAAKVAPGEVSVADVARAARVSWPTANRHLGGKAGLDALLGTPPAPVDPTRTHDRLLAAAARTVAAHGVDGASLDAVSVEAGVTKGALYWHFDTKADLVRALIESRAPAAGSSWPQVIEAHLARAPVEAALDVELAAAARDPEVRARLSARRRAETEALGARLGIEDPAQRVVLHALLDGLSVARRIEPTIDATTLRDAVIALVRPRRTHDRE